MVAHAFKLRQEDFEFEVSLDYIESLSSNKQVSIKRKSALVWAI